jgi:hypothetical protein
MTGTITKRVEQGALTETTGKRVEQGALTGTTDKRVTLSGDIYDALFVTERVAQSGPEFNDRGNPWGDTWGGVGSLGLNFYGWENDGWQTKPSPFENSTNRVDQSTLSGNTTKRLTENPATS